MFPRLLFKVLPMTKYSSSKLDLKKTATITNITWIDQSTRKLFGGRSWNSSKVNELKPAKLEDGSQNINWYWDWETKTLSEWIIKLASHVFKRQDV